MPSTGTPAPAAHSKKPGGVLGEPSSCTLLGPPLRMTTAGATSSTRACEGGE